MRKLRQLLLNGEKIQQWHYNVYFKKNCWKDKIETGQGDSNEAESNNKG